MGKNRERNLRHAKPMDSRGKTRTSGDMLNGECARTDRGRAVGRKERGLPGSVGGASPTDVHSWMLYFNIDCFTFSIMINFKHIQG